MNSLSLTFAFPANDLQSEALKLFLCISEIKTHCFFFPIFYRLLFRIAVFLKVRNVVCFTQRSELLGLYLQSLDGAEQIKYNCLEAGGDADMVYIGRECRVLLKGREKELLEMIGKKKQCVFISYFQEHSYPEQ